MIINYIHKIMNFKKKFASISSKSKQNLVFQGSGLPCRNGPYGGPALDRAFVLTYAASHT